MSRSDDVPDANQSTPASTSAHSNVSLKYKSVDFPEGMLWI